ncbi:reverse transcriptase [Gossypium australe]|uniref:Reverse transcriptase n=1 Tax=Gossypium australe TaxID=47621 RepID=A0A5B6W7N3_9ROSI|nr:reverse transcriptase [Gossypium australe]
MGNPRARRCLLHVLRETNPNVAFFMETKLHSSKMEKVMRSWGMLEGIDISSDGWKQGFKVVLRSFSMNHIDVNVEGDMEDIRWRFTGFYGHLVENLRYYSWDLLRDLSIKSNEPWLVLEDLNEIMYSIKRKRKIEG